MPFSDPMADGSVIQKSSFDALANGVVLKDCFRFVKEARAQGLTVPVVLMGYFNPFMNYGEERTVVEAKEATISGFIVVDLPPDEESEFTIACKKYDLSLIPLVAPTSTDSRLAKISKIASGYVYCVSVTGITGARAELPPDLDEFLKRVRKHMTLPLAVGFGISTRDHVMQVSKHAEGVVVGSAIVRELGKHPNVAARSEAIQKFVEDLIGAGSSSANAAQEEKREGRAMSVE